MLDGATRWSNVIKQNVVCNSVAIVARFKFVSLLLVQFWPSLYHATSGESREKDPLSRRCVTRRGPEMDYLASG